MIIFTLLFCALAVFCNTRTGFKYLAGIKAAVMKKSVSAPGDTSSSKSAARLSKAESFISLNFLKYEKYFAAAVLLTGIFIRVYRFASIPGGLNQDEASIGYDAYAILHYGIDRNGFHNPVYLTAWGSGQNALYAYLSMPFIALVGLSAVSTRLVSLLVGIASLFVFYFLVHRISRPGVAVMSLLILAVSPWHIEVSRWALESNLFPAVFLFAVYFLALYPERRYALTVSMFLFALSLYSYGTSYFVIPLFLSLIALFLFLTRKLDWKACLPAALVFTIAALPIILTVAVNQFKLDTISTALFSLPRLTGAPRHAAVSSLFGNSFLENSIDNFKSFIALLVTQDDGLIWNSFPRYGLFYTFSLPFTLVGICHVTAAYIRDKKINSFIFLAWLLVSALLGFVTEVNVNRVNIVFLPLIYFTAEGIMWTVKRIKPALPLIVMLYFVAFLSFGNYYFKDYSSRIGPEFFESLGESIQYAASQPCEKIYITDKVNMPYIYVLFYEKINPHEYYDTVRFRNPGGDFQQVEAFGRYSFGIKEIDTSEDAVYVVENSSQNLFDSSEYDLKVFKNYTVVVKKKGV